MAREIIRYAKGDLRRECVSGERCVPGGERGSFEDHGEGDPDVLAARRGTKASMCVPLRESRIENRRPRLPGGAGSICSANPTQPRTLSKTVRTIYPAGAGHARIREDVLLAN